MARPEADPKIIYRSIKHPRLEYRSGALEVILPHGEEAAAILARKQDWIKRKLEFINWCLEEANGKKLLNRSDADLRHLVCGFVETASEVLEVEVNSVRFRRMKTKWASCSQRRNLTLNSMTKFLPENLIEYVIFHEAAHIREKRHNDKFWRSVGKKFKDYNELEKDLFSYWFLIQHELCDD